MPDRVLVHGWYGHGNLGDEALLSATLDLLAAESPRSLAFVTSGSPRLTRRDHPRVIPVYTNTRHHEALWRWGARLAGAVIVGGGNLLHEYSTASSTLAELMRRLEFAVERGRTVALLGVGVGERLSAEGAAALRRVAPRVQSIVVRERASARRLAALGITANVAVACDLALWWAQRRSEPKGATARERVLLVNLKGVTSPDDPSERAREAWEIELLLESVRPHVSGWRVVGVPCRRTVDVDSDWHSLEKLRARWGSGLEVLPSVPSPERYVELARSATAVIAGRLHASILAMGAGLPAFGLAYSAKVADLFDEAGLPMWCAAMGDATARARLREFLEVAEALRPDVARYVAPAALEGHAVHARAVRRALGREA